MKVVAVLAAVLLIAGAAGQAFAQAESSTNKPAEPAVKAPDGLAGLAKAGACLGAGLAVVGGGIGIGRIGASMLDGIARQPEAGGQMFVPMIIMAALIEGGMMFAIVLGLLALK